MKNKYPSIKSLVEDGYRFSYSSDDSAPDEIYLAFTSLQQALIAYFRAEYEINCSLLGVAPENEHLHKYGIGYCRAYFKSVIHFQHFFEIIVKYFLRQDHPLLSGEFSHDPILIHKLINREFISQEEEKKILSVTFSDAFKRLESLIRDKRIKDHERLNFFVQYSNALKELNILRNRIWHRGMYTLKGEAFDLFIGCYIFPLIKTIAHLEEFRHYQYLWKLPSISCGINPINEIEGESQSSSPDFFKIALLKQIAESSYSNEFFDWVDNKKSEKVKAKAYHKYLLETEDLNYNRYLLRECPICGLETLIAEYNNFGSNDGVDWDLSKIECGNCNFWWDNNIYLDNYDINRLIDLTYNLNPASTSHNTVKIVNSSIS